MLKYVVLSDLHIVPDGQVSHGLDTAVRFQLAVEHVNEHHGDADFCILAGDLADHGSRDAYRRLQSILPALKLETHLTLGNHDDRNVFLEMFGHQLADENGRITKVIDVKDQRVIVLDTVEQGQDWGKIGPAQLNWLAARLSEAADRPVTIVLHHNICDYHVQTDFIRLMDNDPLVDVLKTHPDFRQVITGHVHMTTSGSYRGIPFSSCGGCHYAIAPTLESRSGDIGNLVPRLEGPGQYAVVLSDSHSTIVHFENFLDRHIPLAKDLFKWDPDEAS